MRSHKEKYKKKKYLFCLASMVIAFLFVAGLFTFIRADKYSSSNSPNSSSEKAGNEVSTEDDNKVSKSNTNSYTESTPDPKIHDVIFESTQSSDDSVTIVAKLYGASDGICYLKITAGNQSVTKEAEVIYQPDYSTCAGFTIPTDQLGVGTWKITLTVESGKNSYSKSTSLEVL